MSRGVRSWIDDVLSPSTDRGVAVEVIAVVAATVVVLWLVRRERALVVFTMGVSMLVLGMFGLRALH